MTVAKPSRRERWLGRRASGHWVKGAVLSLGLIFFCRFMGAGPPVEPLRRAQCDFWQTFDGLPNNNVVSVAQTGDGYIWAGTIGASNSLVRFNGKEFVAAIKPGCGLEDRGTCVAPGKNGRLWVSKTLDKGGLLLWEHGKATSMDLDLPVADARAGRTIPLYEDPQENLWIGGQGLLVRTPEGRVKDFRSLTNQYGTICGMAADKQGTIWLATGNGLVRCRNDAFDQPYPVAGALRAVCPSRNGSLWLGGEGEAALIQVTPSGEIVRYSQAQGFTSTGVAAICEDLKSNLWIGTYSGLCCVQGRRVYPVQEQDLKTAYIFCLICDHEGSLWAGTADGLYRVRDNPFEYYGPTDGLGPMNTLCMGPSGLWASVYVRGLFLYREHAWEHVGISGNMGAENLIEFPAGELWLSIDHQCHRFRKGQEEIVQDINGDMRFCADGQGVWVITGAGLWQCQRGREPKRVDSWPLMEITTVATNAGGGLLIGTTQGVSRWSGQLSPWLRFDGSFPGSRANSLEWEGQSLWLASDVAIGRYQAGRWRVIRPEAGLAETGGINSMLVDRENLWLGCLKGLFRISRAQVEDCLRGALRQATVVQYDRTQGVRPGFFGSGGQRTARDAEGKLWFTSKNGVVAINTAIPLNMAPPPVVVESVRLNQQGAPLLPEPTGPPLRVPAGTRSVDISYAALTFIAPEKVRFKYRLLGLDPDWVRVGQSRVAHYPKLPPGAYEFQAAACNSDGIWNEEGACVKFVQEPFFYQTRTFFVLCQAAGVVALLGLAAAATAVANRISTRKMRRRLALVEAQQSLDRERARIARDIHDDLGSTLTRIVLLTELGRREPEQTHTPEGHLTAIQTAAREITRRLDEIVWAVNPRNDTLDALVTYIGKMATDQARAAGLRCRMDFPPNLPAWPLSGSARHNLFLACKEAVHNAIQHADPTELRLRLLVEEDSLTLEISDNGAGLPADVDERAGDGLQNLRERLAALGGTCQIHSAPGQGTVVAFALPRRVSSKPVSTKQGTCPT